MAEVYRAHDPKMGRDLAVKILNEKMSADEKFRERFQREARAAGILSHPNIVTMFDVGEVSSRPFIAMELLEGVPLDEFMRSGRKLSVQQILHVGIQLADALDYAHDKGIIHRDIKPGNVILDPQKMTIKIADFGIARIEDPDLPKHTQTTEVLGTPQYMSPEQVMGQRIDGRTDLFSTGVLLYQLLSGQKPFKAETLGTLLFRIATEEPVPLRELAPDLPVKILHIVDRLLKKDPEKRFRTGHELAEALREAGRGGDSVPVEQTASFDATVKLASVTTAPATGKSSAAGWVLGLLLAVGAAGAAVYFYQQKQLSPAEPPLASAVPAVSEAALPPVASDSSPVTTVVPAAPAPAAVTAQPAASEPLTEIAPVAAPTPAPRVTVAAPAPVKSKSVTAEKNATSAAARAPQVATSAAQQPTTSPTVAPAPRPSPSPAVPTPVAKPTTGAEPPPAAKSVEQTRESAPAAEKTVENDAPATTSSGVEEIQAKLRFPSASKAKEAYRAHTIDKREYADALRAIDQAQRDEIQMLKSLYKEGKLSKQEYKDKLREAKTKYD